MTDEELAMHWHIPLKEARRISNVINYQYSVELIPACEKSKDGWQVVLRAYDGKKNYILMKEGNDFYDKDQAIIQGTKWAQKIRIPSNQAKLMGLPEDAYMALRPINGYEKACKRYSRISLKNNKNRHGFTSLSAISPHNVSLRNDYLVKVLGRKERN